MLRDRQAHPERAARLALARFAVTHREPDRVSLDSIPHAAALTAPLEHTRHALDLIPAEPLARLLGTASEASPGSARSDSFPASREPAVA